MNKEFEKVTTPEPLLCMFAKETDSDHEQRMQKSVIWIRKRGSSRFLLICMVYVYSRQKSERRQR